MCLAFFEGKGYSNEFTEHMQMISDLMKKNPRINLVAEGDAVCEKCPNLKDGVCNTPELVLEYDRQVLSQCGLEENTEISWNEFSGLVMEKILKCGKRGEICGSCEWDNICKAKEEKLQNSNEI